MRYRSAALAASIDGGSLRIALDGYHDCPRAQRPMDGSERLHGTLSIPAFSRFLLVYWLVLHSLVGFQRSTCTSSKIGANRCRLGVQRSRGSWSDKHCLAQS